MHTLNNLNLTVLLTNAFGLSNKLGELQYALTLHNVDIAIVTETKFSEETNVSDITFPGYSVLRQDRDRHGGGVAVWVRSNLATVHLHAIDTQGHEILWLTVCMNEEQKLVLGAVYRPGSASDNDVQLIDYLESAMDNVRGFGTHMLLAGDFNVHNTGWLRSNKTTPAGEALEEFAVHHNLTQHIQAPTRGSNTLDLMLSDMPQTLQPRLYPPLGRSDHVVVVSDFAIGAPREPPSARRVWRYNRADWGRLRAFFRATSWDEMLPSDECPDLFCSRITSCITVGMERFIPHRSLVSRPCDPKWWTPECHDAMLAKERTWSRWRRNTTCDALKAAFLQDLTHAIQVQLRAKCAWESRIRSKLAGGGLKDKEWWSTLRAAGGETRASSVPTLIGDNGLECSTNAAKADCLGRYFANKCSLGDEDLSPTDLPQSATRDAEPHLRQVHFRTAAVSRLLKKLDTGKATGADGISARVLKECAAELAQPLTTLFSISFKHGRQPSQWKLASVVPIYKKASRSDPKNYRPVSLLSIISKVMERIVNRQLVNHLERHRLLSNKQYGFRRGMGTADLLTLLQHEWALTAGNRGCALVLALDIAGAFDKVSHTGLLHKLGNLGIGGNLLAWIRDYLDKRTLQVVVNGQRSKSFPIRAGVPQGSILGPTLFLVYVNDAESCLAEGTSMGVFADDTTLYSLVRTRAEVPASTASLQRSVDQLHDWGRAWKIKFEPTKSQLLIVSHLRPQWPLTPVTFDGHVIEPSQHVKLLGVTFDSKLTFATHLRNVALRATSRLGFLRRASRVLDPAGRLTTYRGFVRPILEYAPTVWMGAATTHLRQLDRVQRKALHILGPGVLLQSLAERRMVYALTLLYKLQRADGLDQLRVLVPPRNELQELRHPTRSQTQARHPAQLQHPLPPSAPNFLQRAFPYGLIAEWNALPATILPAQQPRAISTNTFKGKVHRYLRRSRWLWATDSL